MQYKIACPPAFQKPAQPDADTEFQPTFQLVRYFGLHLRSIKLLLFPRTGRGTPPTMLAQLPRIIDWKTDRMQMQNEDKKTNLRTEDRKDENPRDASLG